MGLVVFAEVGGAAPVRLHPALALVLMLITWVVVSCALYALLAFLRPSSCDRRKD